jgi:hypothetical protein
MVSTRRRLPPLCFSPPGALLGASPGAFSRCPSSSGDPSRYSRGGALRAGGKEGEITRGSCSGLRMVKDYLDEVPKVASSGPKGPA